MYLLGNIFSTEVESTGKLVLPYITNHTVKCPVLSKSNLAESMNTPKQNQTTKQKTNLDVLGLSHSTSGNLI